MTACDTRCVCGFLDTCSDCITNAAVKADQADFALELRFPANFAAGDVKGIKLIATGPPDPLSGNQPIRTEVEVIVKLVAGS